MMRKKKYIKPETGLVVPAGCAVLNDNKIYAASVTAEGFDGTEDIPVDNSESGEEDMAAKFHHVWGEWDE